MPVDIDNQTHNVYVIKRPGVDTFLKRMGEIYEVVIFTASLSKVKDPTSKEKSLLFVITNSLFISIFSFLFFSFQYADPVLDMLDVHKVVKHRLFRESCLNHKGNYVKVCVLDFWAPTLQIGGKKLY